MKGSIYIYNSNADVPAKVEYPTIDAAVAALVAGDVLNIESGDYTLLAGCDITKPNVAIVGIGEVIIRGAATATYCFKTVLGALTASSEVFFKNIDIIHDGNSSSIPVVGEITCACDVDETPRVPDVRNDAVEKELK